MRRLNLVVLAVIVTVVAVAGTVTHFVHDIQFQRNAAALLESARRAESENDLARAERRLLVYLGLNRDDGHAWLWYARIVEARDVDRSHRDRVYLIHEQALRYNRLDARFERRCADLALELERYSDARGHFSNLLERASKDSAGRNAAAQCAELEDLLGQCERGLARYDEAERRFVRALEQDPQRVACYDRLARLRRTDLRRTEVADAAIREMVANNPASGRAYVYRWRYAQQFTPPGAASDISKALELAPDDPEVLLSAALASEKQEDAVAARVYLEKGCKLDPKNASFAMALARLEGREGHLDRAEAVLRRAYDENPNVELAFRLAETLILEDRIEGHDQAADYIARLRDAGLRETLAAYLEAEILVYRRKWAEAIARIETARVVLRSEPQLVVQLNLMLAECYGRLGNEERRLDLLRQAIDADQGLESARIELARGLARSGKPDEALEMVLPLAQRKPEYLFDVVRFLVQKVIRQPKARQDWAEVERYLRRAEQALAQPNEPLTLLEVDILGMQGRLEEARLRLASALAKDRRNLAYRLAQARLIEREGNAPAALEVLDQTENELGPSVEILLARLEHWRLEGDSAAKAAVAKLAEHRLQVPVAARAELLDRLASVAIELGEPAAGQQYLRELALMRPDDIPVLVGLLELAIETSNRAEAVRLTSAIRAIEGPRGTYWRYGQAADLLEQASRGAQVDLALPHRLAAQLAAERPGWWGSSVILGKLAELEAQTERAIEYYKRAIEAGSKQPAVTRRLVALLQERRRFDEIDRVISIASEHGLPTADLTIAAALGAIRQNDHDQSIALARQVFLAGSRDFSDHLFMGRFYRAAGRPAEALLELRRATELGPAVPATWVSLVQLLVEQKQLDQARAAMDRAREALPLEASHLALAECYALLGEQERSDFMIKAALESPKCDMTTIRVAADLFVNQGRFDQVEPILLKLRSPALKATPEALAWAARTRSLVRLSTGRLAEMDTALELVEQNLQNDPRNPDDLRLKAVLLALRTSRRGDAIKLLEPLDSSNQLGATEQFILAQAYLAERLAENYRAEMRKLLRAPVKNPAHLCHYIDFLIDRDELDEADHWLAELKRVAPSSQAALERDAGLLAARQRKPELLALLLERGRQAPDENGVVARLLERFGFAHEAEKAYNAFVARNPDEPERVLGLAEFLARQDRTQEAVAILERARATCRPEAVAWAALSLCSARSGEVTLRARVEAWVAEAIRKSPAAAAPLRPKLATIVSNEGRYEEAEALFRQILASDPDNVETLNNLAWELALSERGNPGEALELIDRAIEKAGPGSTLVDTRAVALIRAGDPGRAAQELRTALTVDPANVSLALHLAWACQAAGMPAQARAAFQRAEALGLRPEARDPRERGLIERLQRELVTDTQTTSNRT
jgi:tetratricopeptide (TPR) repeat protein